MSEVLEMDSAVYDKLHDLYEELLFPSNTDFEKEVAKLRRAGKLKATPEQVHQFLASVNADVFASRPMRTSHYSYDGYNFCLIADLMFMDGEKGGDGIILNILEWHSRYVWSVVIPSKSSLQVDSDGENAIAKEFKRVLDILSPDKETGPDILIVLDQGKEWAGLVSKLFDEYPWVFRRYSTKARKSTEPVERFNRTLRDSLKRVIKAKGAWKPYLEGLVKKYNDKVHSGTQKKPIDEILSILHDYEMGINHAATDVTPKPLMYPLGSKVRILLNLDTFAKKSMAPKYSDQVYTVTGFEGGYYVLDDGERTTAEQELMLVDLPDEVASAAAAKREAAQAKPRPEYDEARAEASRVRKIGKEKRQISTMSDSHWFKNKVVEGSKRKRKPSARGEMNGRPETVHHEQADTKEVAKD